MCAWSHFLSVSGGALRRNPGMLLCITISFQPNCHSAWTWAWMQLFFCHPLVPWSRSTQRAPAEPPDSSLYRLQFLNLLIRCYCGVTPSAISSLPPRPHQSTWWSACNSDKAVLNGIRSPRPWRTRSVINHSAFWNNSLLMPIRGSNVHLCLQTSCFQTQFTCSRSDLRRLDMSPFQKTRSYIRLLKHISVMDVCAQVSDWSDRKAHLSTQGFLVENWMLLTFVFFIISVSLRHMKQLMSALRNLLLCLTANLVITPHYIFFIFLCKLRETRWWGKKSTAKRTANSV